MMFELPVEAAILLTGTLMAVAAALVGSFLVLRGQSLSTDAIGHAIVLGIVLVWMLTGLRSGPVSVLGAGLAGFLAILGAQALARSGLMRGDAALGLSFTGMFALGVLLISLNARNLHLDTDSVLLGEIALVWLDSRSFMGLTLPLSVWTLALVCLVNIGFLAGFWKELQAGSFDPGFAEVQGLHPRLTERLLLACTALTAVAAFEAVGVVMLLAFVIVPALSASLLARSLIGVVLGAVLFGLFAVGTGFVGGFRADINLGASMALATAPGLVLALLASPRAGLPRLMARRRAAKGAETGR